METDHLLTRALQGLPTARTPVWAMRQAGRWDSEFRRIRGDLGFYEFSENAELSAEASLCPRRFGVDGIILFYDITTIAVAMGMKFTLVPGVGPVPERKATSIEFVKSLDSRPGPEKYDHIIRLLEIVQSELADELPILVFGSAPFTLASYCIGVGKQIDLMRSFISESPECWQLLADKLAEATIQFVNELARRGAAVYQLFDSWAGALVREEYQTWAQPYHQQILSSCSQLSSILFVKECPYVDLMMAANPTAISLGTRHSLPELKKLHPAMIFQGNVDNQILASGDEEQVAEATRLCIEQGQGNRHILNLSHGLDRSTPEANFAAYVQAAKR